MAKKQSRKEFVKQMKGPDEYQKVATRVLNWINENTMVIWASVIPVVLIVVGLIIWQWYAEQQRVKLVNSLGDVSTTYYAENEVIQKEQTKLREKIVDIDQQIAEIEKPEVDPKAKDKKEPKTKKLSSAEKKKVDDLKKQKVALNDQIASLKADHSGSLKEFTAFYEKHSETPQGWVANMQAVAIHIEQKNFDEARKLLGELLAKSKTSTFYQTHGRLVYINLLKDSGEYDKALSESEQLEKVANEQLKPVALLTKAQVLTLKGDKEEALKVLDVIQQDHANTPEADQAKNFRLIVKGV